MQSSRVIRDWPVLLVLVGVQFGHILDFDILLPLGPRYQAELGLGPTQFGLIVSAYGVAACLSGLLAVIWIDRLDRRRTLLCLLSGFVGTTLLCGLASSYEILLVSRCLTGGINDLLDNREALYATEVAFVGPEGLVRSRETLKTPAVVDLRGR